MKIFCMQNTAISDELLSSFDLAESAFLFHMLHLDQLVSNVSGSGMLLFFLAAFLICLVPENNYKTRKNLTVWSLLLSVLCFVWGLLCLGAESVFVYFGF